MVLPIFLEAVSYTQIDYMGRNVEELKRSKGASSSDTIELKHELIREMW